MYKFAINYIKNLLKCIQKTIIRQYKYCANFVCKIFFSSIYEYNKLFLDDEIKLCYKTLMPLSDITT